VTLVWKEALSTLRAPGNALNFAVRQLIGWKRGLPELRNESKRDLFAFLGTKHERRAAEACEGRLRSRYRLKALQEASSRLDYGENLAVLEALERALGQENLPSALRVVDVGAKNWSTVCAVERFFRHHGDQNRDVELDGVEIDAHGMYPDFHSRHDYALAYAAQTQNPKACYWAEDFLQFDRGGYDVVLCMYPFLTRYALLQWGLPLHLFRPERFVERLVQTTRPGGLLVVFNQTDSERTRLHELLPRALAERARCVPIPTQLVHYGSRTQGRWATVVRC
jgi:hypothetical protein